MVDQALPKQSMGIGFDDQRSESIQLQKVKEKVNESEQVMGIAQMQSMANQYTSRQPSVIQKKNNTGLPDKLKSGIENLSGLSMDDVKVHYNSEKPAQLAAHAYAQGTEIHLGSGQEKHLPHEAWHVVQQKQGRVKPTTQLKGKTPINDNAGLEKEADFMGAKALGASTKDPVQTMQESEVSGTNRTSQYKASTNSSGEVIQRLTIEKAGGLGLTAISDNKGLAAPLKTPNHELYFSDDKFLNQMNDRGGAAKNSVIKFSKGGTIQIGDRTYTSALIHDVSLRKTKMNEIKGKLKAYRQTQLDEVEEALNEKYSNKLLRKNLQNGVNRLMDEVEVLKKMLNIEAGKGNVEKIGSLKAYLMRLESLLSDKNTTAANIKTLSEAMHEHLSYDEDLIKLSLFSPMLKMISTTKSLGGYDGQTIIDMELLRQASYLEENIEALDNVEAESNEAMILYKSCDTVASLLLGNKIDLDSSQVLLQFGLGNTFHFATRIASDDPDWVSMEGYAAGPNIGSKIIGDKEGQAYFENLTNRLENSWQFIMYGSIGSGGTSPVDQKNKFFEEYTKFRMSMKGIDIDGSTSDFHKEYRNSKTNLLSYIGGVRFDINGLQPLIDLGYLDSEGYIISSEYFKKTAEEMSAKICKHVGFSTPTLKEHVFQMVSNSQKQGKAAMPEDQPVYGDLSNYLNHLNALASAAGGDEGYQAFVDKSYAIIINNELSAAEKYKMQMELFTEMFN